MQSNRLEAFTDGVVAIIITIMVLELKVPDGDTPHALLQAAPVLAAYVLSFINVGLYWNNHHHLFHATEKVDGRVLWANLGLLFWLSLVPFVIRWMDEAHFTALPTAAYGVILGMAAVSWLILLRQIVRVNGPDSALAQATGNERKEWLSVAIYAAATALAFVAPWIAILLYIGIAGSWFIPDRRIEKRLANG